MSSSAAAAATLLYIKYIGTTRDKHHWLLILVLIPLPSPNSTTVGEEEEASQTRNHHRLVVFFVPAVCWLTVLWDSWSGLDWPGWLDGQWPTKQVDFTPTAVKWIPMRLTGRISTPIFFIFYASSFTLPTNFLWGIHSREYDPASLPFLALPHKTTLELIPGNQFQCV